MQITSVNLSGITANKKDLQYSVKFGKEKKDDTFERLVQTELEKSRIGRSKREDLVNEIDNYYSTHNCDATQEIAEKIQELQLLHKSGDIGLVKVVAKIFAHIPVLATNASEIEINNIKTTANNGKFTTEFLFGKKDKDHPFPNGIKIKHGKPYMQVGNNRSFSTGPVNGWKY